MATETLTQTASITQVPVRFTTQTRYALPLQRFMLPASWRRRELSQLVNKALALPSPVPFDFLARGSLLRTSLEEWIETSGAGTVSHAASFMITCVLTYITGRNDRARIC